MLLIDLDNTLIDRSAAFRQWMASFMLAVGRRSTDDEAWLVAADEDGFAPRAQFFDAVRTRSQARLIKFAGVHADTIRMDTGSVGAAPTSRPRLRWRAIAAALIVVALVAGLAAAGVAWLSRDDPWATAPHLSGRVADYVMLPTLGETYQVGNVEAVLMAVAPIEGGGWGVHLVLHSETGLPKFGTILRARDDSRAPSTCAASGRSGWADCYIALPKSAGATVELELILDREVEGRFSIPLAS